MGHTYYNIAIHVIFSTKQRQNLITPELRDRLYEYLCGVARQEFGQVLGIGGTEDHLHGLISLETDISLAKAMSKWKSLSSGWIHKQFAGSRGFAWQGGYGAFSVSRSQITRVKKYIAGQEKHHRKKTFEQEFVEFLERHEVDYDPATLWD